MIDEILLLNSIKAVAPLSVLNKAIAKIQAMVLNELKEKYITRS